MYLMESALEARRLEAKTDATLVRDRLRMVGVKRGMRLLDAGAGSGAVSRVMCDMVGDTGRVFALDRSAERAAVADHLALEASIGNLHVVTGDVYDSPLRRGSFDLVWAEFLVEYLDDPQRAVVAMSSLVAPGGKLVVGELDGHGLFHYPLPDDVAAGLNVLSAALQGAFDPFAGRKVYHWLYQAGLKDIRVHMLPYHFYPGTAPHDAVAQWRTKFTILAPRVAVRFGGQLAYEKWIERFLAMLADPAVFTYSVLFLVEGTVAV